MCQLVEFLEFTGEDKSMFENQRLPTNDIEIWVEGIEVMFSFFEKPQVSNRVIQKGTALPGQTIRSSLIQEVVRRMQNCSKKMKMEE